MKHWVKLYTDILNDDDIGEMSLEMIGIWTLLLALAGRLDDRTEDEHETGKLTTAKKIAWHMHQPIEKIVEALALFSQLGMVHEADGIFYLTNYPKRQAAPPSARPSAVRQRVQQYRNAHRAADNTECNDDETRYKKSSNGSPSASVSVSDSVSVSELSSSSSRDEGAVFRAWEQARKITSSPLELEQLGGLIDDFGADTVLAGISTAVSANRRDRVSLNFLSAILDRKRATSGPPGVVMLEPGGVA